jgi:DNA-binding LytR/AlgR family response regulator
MRAPTALIAEDEPVLLEELQAGLAKLWPELQVVAKAHNGLEAIQLLDRHEPAIAFLDIEMPGLNGLEVARHCAGRCHVVFVTAYDAYAVAAFEQGAVDYVLKPYDAARLAATTQRLRQRIGNAPASLDHVLRELVSRVAGPGKAYLRWINATKGQEVKLITVDEVCYFQADTKYTRVVTADGETLIRRSLKELQVELDPSCFWAIHRSTIVNANAIAGVTRNLAGHVSVKLKSRSERLTVSSGHQHLFKTM